MTQQKCYDQFCITSSDDGSVLVYDVASVQKGCLEEFYTNGACNDEHIYTVQNQPRKKEPDEIAALMSELAGVPYEQLEDRAAKRRKDRTTPEQKKHGLFFIKLRPLDFKAGSRNKHIDSVTVCAANGLVIGGTNAGEFFIWRVNFNAIRQRLTTVEHFEWIGSFRVHKKGIHQLAFSADGSVLLSGSGDGTARLWRTSFESVSGKNSACHDTKKCPERYLDIDFVEDRSVGNLIHEFVVDPSAVDGAVEFLIDAVEWSKKGRYAYCAISIKKANALDGRADAPNEAGQPSVSPNPPTAVASANPASPERTSQNVTKKAIVKLLVYDTQTGAMLTNDLSRDCGYDKAIYNYTCVMRAHTVEEDIVVASFDGGLCILYDVARMQVLQEIVEYGIYSIDQFTMNNMVDVEWSADGNYLALSSYYGTLSLYSNQKHRKAGYSATRVHQFFPYDNEMHGHNPYEQVAEQPMVGGYELVPYEV